MKIMFLVLLMTGAAMAQQPHSVRPIRLAFVETAEDTGADKQFADSLRVELGKRRDVLFVKRADYTVAVATAEVTESGGTKSVGFAAAILVVESSTGRFKLTVRTAPKLSELVANVATKLDEDFKTREK